MIIYHIKKVSDTYMNDYLFNKFMFDGIKTQKAKNLIEMLNKKGFVEKIDNTFKMPQSDINRVLDYCDITNFEYNLLVKFIENQPMDYYEKDVQKAILKHKSLSEFALLDEKCPQKFRNKISLHTILQKPPTSIQEAVELIKKLYIPKEYETDDFSECDIDDETITSKDIEEDANFLKEKEKCLEIIRNKFRFLENGLSLQEAVENCFNICSRTNDVNYKKELYTAMLSFSHFGQNISYIIGRNIRKEKNPDVLLHIFQNCTKILEPQSGCLDMAVIYDIKDNTAITKDILIELTKKYHPKDYCQNKFYLFIAEWLIEKDVFPKEAYEYYSQKTDFNYSYRNRNADTIQRKILYAKNTPLYAIEMIANKGQRISDLAKVRLSTKMYGKQLNDMYHQIHNESPKGLYCLDNESKAKLLSFVLEDYPLPWVIAALSANNDILNESDMMIGFDAMTYYTMNQIGYDSDDVLNCYIAIKQYENSNAFKLVMAEREYLNEKENEKQIPKREIAEDVLSDNTKWISVVSDITDEEIEI